MCEGLSVDRSHALESSIADTKTRALYTDVPSG
jgi:hypothetical protein